MPRVALFEIITDPNWITQNGTVLGVVVTKRIGRYDIEINIESMKMDGALSSMVISSDVGK